MLEPANQNRAGRIPTVRDPWTEDGDNNGLVKGIALGTVLGVAAWAVLIAAGLAWALWL